MALNANMLPNQYIIVRLSDDMRNYVAWIADPAQVNVLSKGGLPIEPLNATRTTSAATMGTNIQNALPTLSS